MRNVILTQMAFPFASLVKQQFGKFGTQKACIVFQKLIPCGLLGASWRFVGAWNCAFVFNEVVFILFSLSEESWEFHAVEHIFI